MSLFVRDCGCWRLRWYHDEIGCQVRRKDAEFQALQQIWGLPEVEEPYDWQLEPYEDDE